MPELTAESVAKHMLSLLPPDGTPVLNRVMRVMLSRDLEHSIDSELYFKARDILLDEGRVGRLRGQGGQIFLIPDAKKPSQEAPPEIWAEVTLMEPLGKYLNSTFRAGLDLPGDGLCLVQDTSSFGPHRGQWARPDYILVSAMRFRLMPGSQVDVHSFELKTETGCTVQSVHEALAQTRFTHFGHLVWHLPENSKAEARLAEIKSIAGSTGSDLSACASHQTLTLMKSSLILSARRPCRRPSRDSLRRGFPRANAVN
jgi:hypothetical protein